MISRKTKPQSP